MRTKSGQAGAKISREAMLHCGDDDFDSLLERICNIVCLWIVEYQLRREFRKPLTKGPESTGYRPKLLQTISSCRSAKVRDKSIVRTNEDLNEQIANSKRRDLRIVPR